MKKQLHWTSFSIVFFSLYGFVLRVDLSRRNTAVVTTRMPKVPIKTPPFWSDEPGKGAPRALKGQGRVPE